MKAIEKMVEYLRHKEATSVLFQPVWQDAKLEALRLAAEEKAGDEGLRQYLKREIHLLKTQSIEGPFQDGMKYAYENILSRHPAPSRTEELVKVLKAFPGLNCDTEDVIKWICAKEVILADFEKGAK